MISEYILFAITTILWQVTVKIHLAVKLRESEEPG